MLREADNEHTQGTAELFKVDQAVLVLVNQAEEPQRQGALVAAEGPGLQQREEHAELLEAQLVLLQVSQAGVVVMQGRTVHCPVAGEEMLPLKWTQYNKKCNNETVCVYTRV